MTPPLATTTEPVVVVVDDDSSISAGKVAAFGRFARLGTIVFAGAFADRKHAAAGITPAYRLGNASHRSWPRNVDRTFGPRRIPMNMSQTTEAIDQDRRRLLSAATVSVVATGAASLLPAHPVTAAEGSAIRPFRINVLDEQLVDLRRRIAATKWPEKETVADESQGVRLATVQQLARYWATEHDWRKVEARL